MEPCDVYIGHIYRYTYKSEQELVGCLPAVCVGVGVLEQCAVDGAVGRVLALDCQGGRGLALPVSRQTICRQHSLIQFMTLSTRRWSV